MNVGELKVALEGLDDELEVYLSSDEEGNSHHRLTEVDSESFVSDTGWEVEAVNPVDIPEFYDPEDVTRAVILWP
jgi:hypothetical protein